MYRHDAAKAEDAELAELEALIKAEKEAKARWRTACTAGLAIRIKADKWIKAKKELDAKRMS